MKKIIAFLLIFVAVFATACQSGTAKVLSCTVDELFEDIAKVNAEGDLMPMPKSRLEDDMLISSDSYTDGAIFVPEESSGVETIAFFVAKDKTGLNVIKAALEEYIKTTRLEQENYNADNFETAKNAKIYTVGNYIYMVMSPKNSEIVAVIDAKLK